MSEIIPFTPAQADIAAEQVLIRGDLGSLTHAERARYYIRVCQSLGLNPLTKPFDYIVLNGKLTLYALKACTDQLRFIHGVSVSVVGHKEDDGLLTVHVRARMPNGRQDEDFGVVSLPDTMKGDTRANAIMKAITKAKRRCTLSLCGLGMLDETEIETIPEKAKRVPPTKPQTVMPAPKTRLLTDFNHSTDRRYEDVIRYEDKVRRAASEPIDELPDHSAPPRVEPSYADLYEDPTAGLVG
jgi:hypothetical protein